MSDWSKRGCYELFFLAQTKVFARGHIYDFGHGGDTMQRKANFKKRELKIAKKLQTSSVQGSFFFLSSSPFCN